MGFYLLDRRNPNGDHFYTSRREPLLAIVVHVTAGSEDLDTLNDLSAENVAGYAATTNVDVSWHTGSDTDSWVDLLPSNYTAWHATDYNSCTHGHEISKRTTDWRPMSKTWVGKTLRMAALGPDGKSGLRAIAMRNNIPRRWATKAELDAQRANFRAGRPWKPVGFITHAEVQWADRRDPGYVTEGGRTFDTFPRDEFMGLLQQEEEIVDEAQEDRIAAKTINGVYGRIIPLKQFAGGVVVVSMQGAMEYLDYRAQSNNAAVAAVAAKLDAQGAVLRQIAENDDRVTLDPAQLQVLNTTIVDELNEIEAAHQAAIAEQTQQFDQRLDELADELAGRDAESIRAGLKAFFAPAVEGN